MFYFSDSQSNWVLGPRSIGTDSKLSRESYPPCQGEIWKKLNKVLFSSWQATHWFVTYSKERRIVLSVPFVCLFPVKVRPCAVGQYTKWCQCPESVKDHVANSPYIIIKFSNTHGKNARINKGITILILHSLNTESIYIQSATNSFLYV